ncbi:hypothetical protein HanPI659440_Chr15g0616411 [Helianthus annuus]|nr:hypothetical protein HanPI659440_Chr15g0616411 [Helianthus annuus]
MMIMDDVVVADDSVAVGAAKKKTSPETRNSTFRTITLVRSLEFPILSVRYLQEIANATNVSILDPFFPFTLWDATCIPIQNNFYA